MRCYNCGRELKNLEECTYCGASVRMYKKAYALSNALYNEGLYQAGNRELTGAIDSLRKSLRYNKENMDARNLLGLIYFETGEVVDALSEWVISKNIQPEDNPADYYLRAIQSNPNKLEVLSQAIKKYNQALLYCQQGSDDLAVIQLKKVVTDNPRMIRAHQLLALLYFKTKEYDKARKSLNRAYRINKSDPTTLRYMNELDRIYKGGSKERPVIMEEEKEEKKGLFGSRKEYMDSGSFNGLINIIFGVVLGILTTVFLIVPAVKHNSDSSVSNSLVTANEQLVDKSSEIMALEKKIQELEAEAERLKQEAAQTTQVREAYTALYKAMNLKGADAITIAETIEKVNVDLLDEEAKAYYNQLKASSDAAAVGAFYRTANAALNSGNFDEAITYFGKTVAIDEGYQGGNAMLGLAKAYAGKGDTENAKAKYTRVIELAGEESTAGKAAKTALEEMS